MTIEKHKISATEIAENNIKSNSGNRLTGTVEQNKHAFDKLGELIAQKHNELISELVALGVDTTVISENFKNIRLNEYGQLEVSTDGEGYVVAGSAHEIQDGYGNVMETKPILKFSGLTVENEGDATVVYGNTEYEMTEMEYSSDDEELVIVGNYDELPSTFFVKMTTPCAGKIDRILFSSTLGAKEVLIAGDFVDLTKLKEGNYYLINRIGAEQIEIFDPSLDMHMWSAINENSPLPIIKGGHGANNRIDAIDNILTLPNNTAPTEDTPAAWEKLGSCKIYFNASSKVINKPTTYGTLLNFVNKGLGCFQLWIQHGYADMYVRAGNATGWNQNASLNGADAWRKQFGDNNVVPLKNGGSGATTLPALLKVLCSDGNGNSAPAYVIGFDSGYENSGYCSLANLRKAMDAPASDHTHMNLVNGNAQANFTSYGNFYPVTDGNNRLGTADHPWVGGYFSNSLYVGGAAVSVSGHEHSGIYNEVSGERIIETWKVDSSDFRVIPDTEATFDVSLGRNEDGKRFKHCVLMNSPTVSSDMRMKEDFNSDMTKYIAMMDLLSPTTYLRKDDKEEARKRNVGYVAQKVLQAMKEVGLEESDFAGLVKDMQEKGPVYTYGLGYEQFIPILHARQDRDKAELKAENESLRMELELIKGELASIKEVQHGDQE